MPTYAFRCGSCGRITETVMSISAYVREAPVFACCSQTMDRYIETVPGMALHSPLANDRHYEGMRATDGTDISSRAKHQAYMKANNLTTADDFKDTWAKAAREREQSLNGQDSARRSDIVEAVRQLKG